MRCRSDDDSNMSVGEMQSLVRHDMHHLQQSLALVSELPEV